jgi:hypothetical protein
MTSTLVSDPLAMAQTTGTMAGHAVKFTAVHREENETPVAVELTMALPLSLEDIEAALWIVINGGMTFDELTDDDFVRQMVAETLLAEGGSSVTDARLALASFRPRTSEYVIARQIRRRVREVFGTKARGRSQAASRELAGVA